MNIYQLLGVLTDLEVPDGVISISTKQAKEKKRFVVHMTPVAFMAAFPQHQKKKFDSEYDEYTFQGENVTVMCLVKKQ